MWTAEQLYLMSMRDSAAVLALRGSGTLAPGAEHVEADIESRPVRAFSNAPPWPRHRQAATCLVRIPTAPRMSR